MDALCLHILYPDANAQGILRVNLKVLNST